MAGYIISLIIILIIPIIIGQVIAQKEDELFKLKQKDFKGITKIAINNFYGNLISTIGFIIDFAIIFDIREMTFWCCTALIVFIAYVKHVRDATGESLDIVILDIIKSERKNRKVMLFQYKTIALVFSIIITGGIMTGIVVNLLF